MDLMDPQHHVIAAFTDGEAVDPDELKRALAQPDGRDELVDLLVLRGIAGSPPPARALPGHVAGQASRLRRWAAVAALVVLGAAGGFALGTQRPTAPPPAMVVDNTVTPADNSPAPPAPAPTRVIRLRSGVDWRETQGGGQ